MSEAVMTRLAKRAAEHPDVQTAVFDALKMALPKVIEAILREEYAGENLQFYVRKGERIDRAARANMIRSSYNGRNIRELSKQHKLSERQIRRILKV